MSGLVGNSRRHILSCRSSYHVSYSIWHVYAKYHCPFSSGSPDILFRRYHRFTVQKSKNNESDRNDFFSCSFHTLNFKILSLTVLDRMQIVTNGRTNGQTCQNQHVPSTSSKLEASKLITLLGKDPYIFLNLLLFLMSIHLSIYTVSTP